MNVLIFCEIARIRTQKTIGVFTSTGVTGYKGIRVTFCNVFKWRKVTLIPLYPVTPVLVNTPYMKVVSNCPILS